MSGATLIESLAQQWLEAKRTEQQAAQKRRELEDTMLDTLSVDVDGLDGTLINIDGAYKIRMVGRINRTVDGDRLQDIAAEHGLSDHLSSLFRWKPSLNMKAWDAADDTITRPLSAAITSKPGRVTFTIEKEQD